MEPRTYNQDIILEVADLYIGPRHLHARPRHPHARSRYPHVEPQIEDTWLISCKHVTMQFRGLKL